MPQGQTDRRPCRVSQPCPRFTPCGTHGLPDPAPPDTATAPRHLGRDKSRSRSRAPPCWSPGLSRLPPASPRPAAAQAPAAARRAASWPHRSAREAAATTEAAARRRPQPRPASPVPGTGRRAGAGREKETRASRRTTSPSMSRGSRHTPGPLPRGALSRHPLLGQRQLGAAAAPRRSQSGRAGGGGGGRGLPSARGVPGEGSAEPPLPAVVLPAAWGRASVRPRSPELPRPTPRFSVDFLTGAAPEAACPLPGRAAVCVRAYPRGLGLQVAAGRAPERCMHKLPGSRERCQPARGAERW